MIPDKIIFFFTILCHPVLENYLQPEYFEVLSFVFSIIPNVTEIAEVYNIALLKNF